MSDLQAICNEPVASTIRPVVVELAASEFQWLKGAVCLNDLRILRIV
jgi:hypothetical protein